jgi:hypothetical protein
MDVACVGMMNLFQFFQAAHPVGLFGAEQVALAGMHAHHFPRGRNLEAFCGAAMRLELELLYLFCHKRFLSEIFYAGQASACLVLRWGWSKS